METFTLETDRLLLERMTRDIAEMVQSTTSHPEFGRGFPTPGDLTVARRVLDETTPPNEPFYVYLLRERSSGLLIGGAGFHGAPNGRTVEIGYALARAFQGYGYATEACGALVNAAFASDDVDQIVASTDPDNWSSHGVLRRLGFTVTNDVMTHWAISRT